jgi:hypothetical protein
MSSKPIHPRCTGSAGDLQPLGEPKSSLFHIAVFQEELTFETSRKDPPFSFALPFMQVVEYSIQERTACRSLGIWYRPRIKTNRNGAGSHKGSQGVANVPFPTLDNKYPSYLHNPSDTTLQP